MRLTKRWIRAWAGSLLLLCAWVGAWAQQKPIDATPSVALILERNAQARGGLDAWRRIQSMVWAGHVEVVNRPDQKLTFLLEQRRPGSSRFEIFLGAQKSVRIYNGKEGWKVRSNGMSKPEMKAFSEDELQFAHDTPVIDGLLMDYVAKAFKLRLAGSDMLDGRQNHVLSVTLPGGMVHRVWVDAETFLESRLDREFRKATGQMALTTVRYRDYHAFEGLLMPVTIETGAQPGADMGSKLVIERIALNPELGDDMFDRPNQQASVKRSRVTVDTRSAASQGRSVPALPQ
jgi:hypothetical protein